MLWQEIPSQCTVQSILYDIHSTAVLSLLVILFDGCSVYLRIHNPPFLPVLEKKTIYHPRNKVITLQKFQFDNYHSAR